jgi:hypothetical protein
MCCCWGFYLASLLQTHQVSLGLRELLKPAATHRLGELLKLYGREDLVTSVDEVGIEEFLEIKYLCMGGIARKGQTTAGLARRLHHRQRKSPSSSFTFKWRGSVNQQKHANHCDEAYHG